MRINFQNFLVKSDSVCDYIPFISTVNNVVDIFQKIVVTPFLNKSHLSPNGYYAHLAAKSWTRCFVSLIPLVGNIFVIISDLFRTRGASLPKLGETPKIRLETERRNLIAKLPEEWDAFKTAPEYLRRDPAAALAAINQSEDNLAFVSSELWSNKDFVFAAIEKTRLAIFLPEKDIQNDRDTVSHFFKHHSLDSIKKDLFVADQLDTEENWINRVKEIRDQLINARCAENTDEWIQKLPSLVYRITKVSIVAAFIPQKFLENKAFIHRVTDEISKEFFKFARGDAEEDQQTVANLLKSDADALKFLPTRLLKNRDFMVGLFAMRPHIYKALGFKLENNEQFFLDAIKQNSDLPDDRNFKALITVPFAIQVIRATQPGLRRLSRYTSLPEHIREDEVFQEAVKKIGILHCINPGLLNPAGYALDLFTRCPQIYRHLDSKLQNNEEFLLDAIKKNPKVLKESSLKARIDTPFAMQIIKQCDTDKIHDCLAFLPNKILSSGAFAGFLHAKQQKEAQTTN